MELDIILSTVRQVLEERRSLCALPEQIRAAYGDGHAPSIPPPEPLHDSRPSAVDIRVDDELDGLDIHIFSEGDEDDTQIHIVEAESPQDSLWTPSSELEIQILEDQLSIEVIEPAEPVIEQHPARSDTPDLPNIDIRSNDDRAPVDTDAIRLESADLEFDEEAVEQKVAAIKRQVTQNYEQIVTLRRQQVQISNAFAQQDAHLAQQQAAALGRYDRQLIQQQNDQVTDRQRLGALQQQINSERQRLTDIQNEAGRSRKALLIGGAAGTALAILTTAVLLLLRVKLLHGVVSGAAVLLAAAIAVGIGWLWLISRSREAGVIRGRITQLEGTQQHLIASEGSMAGWLQEQRQQEKRHFQLERDSLREQSYRLPQEAVTQELRSLYENSVNSLVPEGLHLLDTWLTYLAERLRTWHTDWSNPVWITLDAKGLLERKTSQNPGLRVGALDCALTTTSVPAVIDPIGNRRHVFIRGGDGGIRADLMRDILLRFVLAFPVGLARLLLIDGEEQGRNLSLFAAKLHQDIANGQVYDRDQTIAKELSAVRERITQITQHVLVDFETLDSYNQANPEIALPYQFVVVSNLPKGLDASALHTLQDIARNGPRAGIYILATVTEPLQRLHDFDLVSFVAGNYVLDIQADGVMRWNSEYLGPYGVQIERVLAEETASRLLQTVNRAYELKPVVVRYERITRDLPPLWSVPTDGGIRAPVGLTFGGRLHTVEFNDEIVHGLIGGRTGSGKTVFLHDLICGLAQAHAPEDLDLYLLDFKGTEFSVYARNTLPHARVVAVDCDVEVGLSVIRRLTAERERRRQLFHEADVENIQRYREKGHRLPRILLVIDELQMLTQAADARLVQDVERNLVELLKLGRAAGIHVLMGTQSPSSVLSPQMLQQTAMRICLLADPQVSRLVLGDTNEAASALQRQGEAVFNAYNGQREKNVFMRAALLERQQIAEIVSRLRDQVSARESHLASNLLYFDGGSRGSLLDYPALQTALESFRDPPMTSEYALPVGEPIDIKSPTALILARRQYGNLILVGSELEPLHGLWRNIIAGLCILRPADTTSFYMVDLTPQDHPCANISQTFSRLPQDFQFALSSAAGVTLVEDLYKTFRKRRDESSGGTKADNALFLAIFGMENFIDTRVGMDYSKPMARQHLEEMLKEGPGIGIHCIIATQTLEKGIILKTDDFGQRVCFQTSEDDSRALLNSDAGTKLLRTDRAIYRQYDWPYGKVEKFKPYAGLDAHQLQHIAAHLVKRAEAEGSGIEQGRG